MQISEVSAHTGLNLSTIRYYEKCGLCPPIRRGADGKRRYSGTDADWLLLLASLRETGMSLTDMKAFAALYAAGDATVADRKKALLAHRETLAVRQAALDRCAQILDRKLKMYDAMMGER